jgi:G:T-mismatch repair DNA endonuclease (very short patch repair protein)
MNTVRDLLVWYNNLDVVPFLEALERQCAVYRRKGIDMLKDALSLPGLSTAWLFATVNESRSLRDVYEQRLTDGLGEYAAVERAVVETRGVHCIDPDNADLYELFKRNTVGGPSIVFHRYHEKNVTRIRSADYGDEARPCRRIMGVDANALYLYCASSDLPVGRPRRRFEEGGLTIDRERKSQKGKTAQGWLGWIEFSEGRRLRTAVSEGGERRIGRHGLPVDGYDADSRTVYQFHGCFWHGHGCCESASRPLEGRTAEERLATTRRKDEYVRSVGYRLRIVWECEWRRDVDANPSIRTFLRAFYRRAYGDTARSGLTLERALEAIRARKLFGFVECDVRVPDHLTSKFSEMPPIFKNVELSREQLPDHMREFAERENHMPRPQRSLIGSMRGDRILLFTDLLVWYLEHGLVVDRIYQIVEYEANAVYREFGDSVTSARRAGDVDATPRTAGQHVQAGRQLALRQDDHGQDAAQERQL